MSFLTLLVMAVLALLGLFAAVNWDVFIAPTHLSLIVTSVDAPLGLVMLGFAALLVAVLMGYALKVQFIALADSRKQTEELRRQRELADQAEASRFTDLKKHLDQEIALLRQAQLAGADRLHEEIVASTNTLAACIGEVDERLERQWPVPLERQP
ncbi:MAG: LapA family protein [Gammaproteobacteria bacterium]|nr:LapA family protein [Gammaproteobacteria bacterium]MDH4311911.1 LapA family protein [Gammaproteobacteria bacterium]MDH5272479.1 LapA family protein [Gammaproteobacteria bacterium]